MPTFRPLPISFAVLTTLSFSLIVRNGEAAEKVLIYDNLPARTAALRSKLQQQGFSVGSANSATLNNLKLESAALLVVASDTPYPAQGRAALSQFLGKGGSIVVIGPRAFDYTPQPSNAVALSRFDAPQSYRVVTVERVGSMKAEVPQQSTTTGPDKKPALRFTSKVRGMKDVMVQLDTAGVRSPKRSVLRFQARGDAYMDLLALEATDTAGKKWLNFVPLAPQWRQYTVSLADFLPAGWNDPAKPYPLLQPARLQTLALGVNNFTVWREKPMDWALGTVELAENSRSLYAPTAALARLRLPFLENEIATPNWIFDPFSGATALSPQTTIAASGAAPLKTTPPFKTTRTAWLCPPPFREHPGTKMGTDNRKNYVTRQERSLRRIALWQAPGQAGFESGTTAELRIPAGGPWKNASIGIFGFTPEEVMKNSRLLDSVVQTVDYMLRRPKVAEVIPNTTELTGTDKAVPLLKVTVQNPLGQAIKGKLVAHIGNNRVQGQSELTVPAHGTATGTIKLGDVPADFSFTKFDWQVTFENAKGSDTLKDTVDIERSLIRALRQQVRAQSYFPDGRITNHYFGDAYGVRAMFAYLDLLRRQPERLQHNRDLWRQITPEQIRAAGLRFGDMLVKRQNPGGWLPMGYGEPQGSSNIADGGQITLGLAQIGPLLRDETRRQAYLQVARHFADWAETYYIDEARFARLQAEKPDDVKKDRTQPGFYGLGLTSAKPRETAPFWVLPDILGTQVALATLQPQSPYPAIADRNIKFFLQGDFSAAGHFHSEAMFWAWLHSTDPTLRRQIAERLTSTFIPGLLKGTENEMLDLGGRATLKGLPLIYYRRYIADTPDARAALLKYVWAFGSESSGNSMRRLSEAFPKPAHGEAITATKYAEFSSIWAAELLDPGITLLQDPNFIKEPLTPPFQGAG